MLSADSINQIKELYQNGMLKKDIATIVNCSLTTVGKYTKGLQVEQDEMIGKIFGNLTVIKRAPKRKEMASRCIRYICQCSCGNIIEINGNALRNGHTKSCGCSRKATNIKDICGQKFGALTAIEYIRSDKERRAIWRCRCDCGNEVEVAGKLLLSGGVKSCGCIKDSLGQIRVKQLLTEMNLEFSQEYRFSDCRNIKPLPFDFAIFENGKLICLIEYQGDIHYKATGGWNSQERLIKNQERDNIKRKYCEEKKIKLVTIPYTDYDLLDIDYMKGKIYD